VAAGFAGVRAVSSFFITSMVLTMHDFPFKISKASLGNTLALVAGGATPSHTNPFSSML